MSFFPEPYTHSKNKTEVELDLSDYGAKPELKNVTDVNKLKFAKKTGLASLKSEIDLLD